VINYELNQHLCFFAPTSPNVFTCTKCKETLPFQCVRTCSTTLSTVDSAKAEQAFYDALYVRKPPQIESIITDHCKPCEHYHASREYCKIAVHQLGCHGCMLEGKFREHLARGGGCFDTATPRFLPVLPKETTPSLTSPPDAPSPTASFQSAEVADESSPRASASR